MWIGCSDFRVEIEVHLRLVDAIKVLQVRECHESIVAKAARLIGSQLG